MRRAWLLVGRALPALAVAAFLLLPSFAVGHVEVKPERAPAGDEARLTFEVPNERAGDVTRRIAIQMPGGVTSVEALSLRGWRLTTRRQGEQVRRVTLTAPRGRELSGEQRGRFRMIVGLPRREGATLVFKVLQVYDSGEIVRWIGPEGTSEPAATLRLTAAQEPPPAEQPSGADTQPRTETAPATEDTSDEGGDGGGGVPIWAGIGLMLLAAGAGTALARRRNRRRFEERYRR